MHSTRSTVSVAMMSCSRMAHFELALQLIEQQDYSGKLELVVVADGPAAQRGGVRWQQWSSVL